MKTCGDCKIHLRNDKFNKHKQLKGGLYPICRECRWARKIWKLYRLTPDDYYTMLDKQWGVCAICSRPPVNKKLSVDHCHATDLVRGLLCNDCNMSIGKLGDNAAAILKAYEYLLIAEGRKPK